MIIWILLTVLIVTAIAITLGIVFGYIKSRKFRKVMYIAIAICIGIVSFCGILGNFYENKVAALEADYSDIMLYHDVVNECDNEKVRFGHYEKIMAYNEQYANMVEIANNSWFGTLVRADWSNGFGPIEFYFRGIYGTEG